MSDPAAPDQSLDEAMINGWQRLAPGAVAFFAINVIIKIIGQGAQAVAPAIAGLAWVGTRDTAGELIIGVAILLAVLIPFAILSYLRFTFQVQPDRILVRQGVLQRKETTLPYDRVQNVNIEQPIYLKPLRLVKLKLDSAGSQGKEVSLPGIPLDVAETLRHDILDRMGEHKGAAEVSEAAAEEISDKPALYEMTSRDLMIEGLISNNVFIFAGLLAGIIGGAEEFIEPLYREAKNWIESEIIGQSAAILIFMAMTAAVGFLFLLAALSIVAAFIRYFRYRLVETRDGFRHSYGLLERKDIGLKHAKIQSLRLTQSILARLTARWALQMVQPGGDEGQNKQPGRQQGFIVPAMNPETLDRLISKVYGDLDLDGVNWHPISELYVWRTWLIYWVPLPLLVAAINGYFGSMIPVFIALAIPFPALFFIWLKFKQTGFALHNGYGLFRTGVLNRRLRIFPLYKIHTVGISQGPSEQRNGLASLRFRLAGPNVTIPFMPLEAAQDFRDLALLASESDSRPWI